MDLTCQHCGMVTKIDDMDALHGPVERVCEGCDAAYVVTKSGLVSVPPTASAEDDDQAVLVSDTERMQDLASLALPAEVAELHEALAADRRAAISEAPAPPLVAAPARSRRQLAAWTAALGGVALCGGVIVAHMASAPVAAADERTPSATVESVDTAGEAPLGVVPAPDNPATKEPTPTTSEPTPATPSRAVRVPR